MDVEWLADSELPAVHRDEIDEVLDVPDEPSPPTPSKRPDDKVNEPDEQPASGPPQPMDEDEEPIHDLFMGSDDEGNDDSQQMVNALIAAGTDKHTAQIFTNTACSIKSGASFIEVYSRGHIMAEANGPRRSLNIDGPIAPSCM